MLDSRRLKPRSTSQNFWCQCPCPCGEPQPHPTSAGDPPTLASRSGSGSYGVTTPSLWVLMHTLLCVCPPRVEFLFSPVLPKSCNQIPLDFKVWFSRNSSSRCWTPRLGNLTWGSEHSLQWVNFCGIVVSSLWVMHPVVMGFDFIVIAPLLPSHCGSSFVSGCEVSFLVSSSVFLSMIVQQLVVIPVLSIEGVSARSFSFKYYFKAYCNE